MDDIYPIDKGIPIPAIRGGGLSMQRWRRLEKALHELTEPDDYDGE